MPDGSEAAFAEGYRLGHILERARTLCVQGESRRVRSLASSALEAAARAAETRKPEVSRSLERLALDFIREASK